MASSGPINAVSIVAPTVSAALYAVGNCVGGIQTLPNAVQGTKGAGHLQSLTIADKSNQKAPLSIFLFSAQPAGGTYADKGGLVLSAADMANCLGVLNVAAANYVTVGSQAVATISGQQLPVYAKGGVIYALAMTTGTPTYTSTTALQFTYGVQQN